MRRWHKLIIFLHNFGTGMLAPVLSLLLLSRGCTLATLGLVIAVYSAVVIVAEVPTGVFADLRGRKTAAYLSCALYAVSFGIILISNHMFLLITAMLFQGIGRALSSGSMEALIIEDAAARHGEAVLSKTTSQLAVIQSIGAGAGALTGGFIPDIKGYSIHLIIRLLTLAAVFILVLFFVKEQDRNARGVITLREHLATVKRLASTERPLRYVILCIAASSVMMFTIETYWQPALTGLTQDNMHILLGILCTAGFLAMAFGSFMMGKVRLATPRARWTLYILLLLAMAISLMSITVVHSVAMFAVLYIAWYLFLGSANVPEQTIINMAVPNETRAAALSTASLSCQLGGVLSSAVCSVVIAGSGFAAIWLVGPTLTILTLVFVLLRRKKIKITDPS